MFSPRNVAAALSGLALFSIPSAALTQSISSTQAQRLAAQRNQALLQQQYRAQLQARHYRTPMNRQAVQSRPAGVSGARPTASNASMRSLITALNAFSADVGRMPTQAEGLQVLLRPPANARNWRGPYISQTNWRAALADPWGNPYRYTVTPAGRYSTYIISSDGPDRTPGTADDLKIQF